MTLEELHNYWCGEFTDEDVQVFDHKDNPTIEEDHFLIISEDPAISARLLSRREALLLTRELVRALGIKELPKGP